MGHQKVLDGISGRSKTHEELFCLPCDFTEYRMIRDEDATLTAVPVQTSQTQTETARCPQIP